MVTGRYRILHTLGRGGFSEVCLAEDTLLGDRKVAIKRIAYHHLHDEERVERFKQEADIVGRLTNSNIVRAYDYGKDENGRYFIVLEYVEGLTLHEVLQNEAPLSVSRTVHIATQLLDALEEAHQLGIIHRDLKPKNIILVSHRLGDLVKVLDFGVARILSPDDDDDNDWTLVGTASYMAPEQAQGKPISPASDLYSVGVLLYHALTGKPPFVSQEDPVAVMIHHATKPVTPMREARPYLDIPQAIDDVVLKALEKKPEDRFQQASAFREALEQALAPENNETKRSTASYMPAFEEEEEPTSNISGPRGEARRQARQSNPMDPPVQSGTLHRHLPPPPMITPATGATLDQSEEDEVIETIDRNKEAPLHTIETDDIDEPSTISRHSSQLATGSLAATSQSIKYFDEAQGALPHEDLITAHSIRSHDDDDDDEDLTSRIDTGSFRRELPLKEEELNTASHRGKEDEDEELLKDLGSLHRSRTPHPEEPGVTNDDLRHDLGLSSVEEEAEEPTDPSTLDLKPTPSSSDLPPMLPLDDIPDDWDGEETRQTTVRWQEGWRPDDDAKAQEDEEDEGEATISLAGNPPSRSIRSPRQPEAHEQEIHTRTTANPGATTPQMPASPAATTPQMPAAAVTDHTLDPHLDPTQSQDPSPFFNPRTTQGYGQSASFVPTNPPVIASSTPPLASALPVASASMHAQTPPVATARPSTPTPYPPQPIASYPLSPTSSPPDPLMDEPPATWDDPEDDLDFPTQPGWRNVGIFGAVVFLCGLVLLLASAGDNQKKLQQQRRDQAFKDSLQEGDRAIRKGLYHKAYASYRQALKLRPKDPDALRRLRLAEIDLEAQTYIRRALSLRRAGKPIGAYHLLERINTKSSLWEEHGKKLFYTLHKECTTYIINQIKRFKKERKWKRAANGCRELPKFSSNHPMLKRPCPYIIRRAKRTKRR